VKTTYPKNSQLERNFQCGFGAYKNGYSIESCPYSFNSGLSWFEDERQAWLNGWIAGEKNIWLKIKKFLHIK
jgi:ribosome modulation factor